MEILVFYSFSLLQKKKTIDEIERDTYRLPRLISTQDTEAEACILPPEENVLLLAIWH